jgi:cystathionine beta-lyase
VTVDANPLRSLSEDQLRLRTSEKWRTYPEDVLPVFVAELDVPLAGPIVEAITGTLRRGDTGYPAGHAYAEAFAAFARQRWNWDGVDAERTTMAADVMEGLLETLGAVSGRSDAVVVNCPVYPPFYWFVKRTGRSVEEAPFGADGRIDLVALEDAFRRAAAKGPRPAFLLCNPHNPTGVVHTAAELTAVAALAARHGVRVVADEIFAPVVLPGARFTPYLSVPGAGHGFAVMSASKGWNLAGFKAAVVIAGPDAVTDLHRIPDWIRENPGHVGVIAHTAALRDGVDWLDSLLFGLDENRRILQEQLTQHLPEIVYHPGEGTYLAWLDCRALALGDDPAKAFLDRGRVALSSGPAFGTGGAGHARFNLGTSPELITEAVRRMAVAIQRR